MTEIRHGLERLISRASTRLPGEVVMPERSTVACNASGRGCDSVFVPVDHKMAGRWRAPQTATWQPVGVPLEMLG